jgi:hypothetical protein
VFHIKFFKGEWKCWSAKLYRLDRSLRIISYTFNKSYYRSTRWNSTWHVTTFICGHGFHRSSWNSSALIRYSPRAIFLNHDFTVYICYDLWNCHIPQTAVVYECEAMAEWWLAGKSRINPGSNLLQTILSTNLTWCHCWWNPRLRYQKLPPNRLYGTYIYIYIQGVPGGKVSIQGGHSIGHSKQKRKCICTCVLFRTVSEIELKSSN